MSEHVYKIIELTGSSKSNIEDAVQNAITESISDDPQPAVVPGVGDEGTRGRRQGRSLAGHHQDRLYARRVKSSTRRALSRTAHGRSPPRRVTRRVCPTQTTTHTRQSMGGHCWRRQPSLGEGDEYDRPQANVQAIGKPIAAEVWSQTA